MPVPGAHVKSDGSAGIGPRPADQDAPEQPRINEGPLLCVSQMRRASRRRGCCRVWRGAKIPGGAATGRLSGMCGDPSRGGRQAAARASSRSPAAALAPDRSACASPVICTARADRGGVAVPGALYRRGRTGHLTVRGVAAASAILLIARVMRVLGHSALLALLGWIDVSGFRRGLCPLWVQALLGRGTDAMLRAVLCRHRRKVSFRHWHSLLIVRSTSNAALGFQAKDRAPKLACPARASAPGSGPAECRGGSLPAQGGQAAARRSRVAFAKATRDRVRVSARCITAACLPLE